MGRAIASMVLVALTVLAAYGLVLAALAFVPGLDVVMPAPIAWVGAFAVATTFAAWNLWDALLDARGVVTGARRLGRPVSARTLAGGLWHLRSHALQGACCTAWTGAGALAIVQWGPAEVRAALIFAGAVALVANQIWNRLDRERVVRMPGPAAEARVMERVAVELAAIGRQIGHDVAGSLQQPVGVLEALRARPGMTPEEVAEIDAAVRRLLDLAEHVRILHQRAREHDPSLRGPGP